jgi:uncharacterized protein involved in type VI secretion and phage assembly
MRIGFIVQGNNQLNDSRSEAIREELLWAGKNYGME